MPTFALKKSSAKKIPVSLQRLAVFYDLEKNSLTFFGRPKG